MPTERDGRVWYDSLEDFASLGMSRTGAYYRRRYGQPIDMGPVGCIWYDVPGLPSYQVTACGLLRRVGSDRGARLGVMATGAARNRAAWRRLYHEAGAVVGMHHLVARACLPPPPSADHVLVHRNGDKTDNRASNLAYALRAARPCRGRPRRRPSRAWPVLALPGAHAAAVEPVAGWPQSDPASVSRPRRGP